jgi:hypothetical protein
MIFGARIVLRASLAVAAGVSLAALAPGASFAQHAYDVGPPVDNHGLSPVGPVRHDTDADRFCLGGYNSGTPYALNTCLPWPRPGYTMTRTIGVDGPAQVETPVDRAIDVPDAIAACWRPPASTVPQQITIRVSFSRAARPVGEPKITFVQAPTPQAKAALKASLLEAMKRCAPLPLSPSLGRAIAGRPFAIRFILSARG